MRGLYLNSCKSVCSIYEIGVQCYDILKRSTKYQLDYAEEPFFYTDVEMYDFVIVNFHFMTNNWVTPEYLQMVAKRSYAIVTEVMLYGKNVLEERTPEIFDYYIVLDPSIPETNSILSFPRPLDLLPTQEPISASPIPIIGSFGLPTDYKAWGQIVEGVNHEFEEAIIRFNIPYATYVPGCDKRIQAIIAECKKQITKPKIQFQMTHDVMSRQDLVNWCAENTINCFFYFRCHILISGLAAVTDQAIAANKPLLVTSDKTFRHIHPYIPYYPNIGIREAIEKTKDGVTKMRTLWCAEKFLEKFESHVVV